MKKNDVIVRATARVLKSTPSKLNLVADLVRNSPIDSATIQLKFCDKKASGLISKVLCSAIANAQYNYGLDVDSLYIKEILIGKSFTLRRMYPKAMGRASRVKKRYSNLTIGLAEI